VGQETIDERILSVALKRLDEVLSKSTKRDYMWSELLNRIRGLRVCLKQLSRREI
jgi:hypothetical protein